MIIKYYKIKYKLEYYAVKIQMKNIFKKTYFKN